MNAIPFLILQKTPRSDYRSALGSGTPSSTSLPQRPNEPMPLANGIESATAITADILLPRAAKRSHETAFGILPPSDHLHGTPRQGSVMPGAEPAVKRIRTAVPNAVEHLSLPDLIEGAMSTDDETAISFFKRFLAWSIVPGPDFAEFIEGWKILASHAADRQPPLQGWGIDKVFCEGMSHIRDACAGVSGSGKANEDAIREQMEVHLFDQGTPTQFIKYAEDVRRHRRDAGDAKATYSIARKAIVKFTLLTSIKVAHRRLSRETEDLPCQQRVDAMRTRLAERPAAAAPDLFRPGAAGLTSANVGHTSFKGLLALLEKGERIGLAHVNSALLEHIQTLEQIPSRIRMVQACSIHLGMASNRVDGFDAVALIRLAGVRLEAQAVRYGHANGNGAATKFRHAVKTQILDADTPHEYIHAARAAHEWGEQPREVDDRFSIEGLKKGLKLVASTADLEGFVNTPDWMKNSGRKSYEMLLAECSIAVTRCVAIPAQTSDTARTASMPLSLISSIARPATMAPGTSTTARPVLIELFPQSATEMPATPST
ncbi:MAG TPA: hypothetical protein VF797_04630 [Noviherbaspirillum sp.]